MHTCAHDILSQVITSEQHWPTGHATAACKHVEPSGQPPLSVSHEKSQYAVSVSSHTLQTDPVGHWKPVQAVMKKCIKQGL